jgi:hypothetical protein
MSYCIIEEHEYTQTERMVIRKESKLIIKNYKQHKMSYYDSCVM